MRIVYLILGLLCIGLGAIGVVLPILPTTPFLMLAVFFLARSSERLHTWFLGTKLYERHLKSFVQKRAMTKKTKLSIMTMVTAVMVFAFVMMRRVPAAQMILLVVWIAHIWYFLFRIKTERENKTAEQETAK